ncbi:MAG: ABC-2 type transport system permease protein, partial [Gammaproteobacteria bacterium]
MNILKIKNLSKTYPNGVNIILPNVFICTSIVFSVSALTKNNIATYISAVSIYALYMICSIFFNSPLLANSVPPSAENMALAALADPFGLSAFFEQTQYWTVFEKNTKAISLSGYFMWNRFLWISVSSLILAFTYRLFSFRTVHQKTKETKEINNKNSPVKAYQPSKPLAIDNKAQGHSFLSLLKINLSNVFTSLPFLALMLIWIVIVFIEIYTRINHGGNYNDSQYPTTDLMVWLIEEPLILISLALIVFYSGEIIWRERNLNFNSFIDSTPVSNIVLFLAKLSTLLLLPAIFILTGIAIAIGFQISKGYYQFEVWQYLSMFYFAGAQLFFISLLAFFIQSLCNNKYLGMMITGLIVLLLGSNLSGFIGVYHPLLKIGSFPPIDYSNMNGYGYSTIRFHQIASYWISVGIILSLLSFKLWRRGNTHQFSFRLKQLFSNWKKWQQLSLVVFSLLFVISGSAIFYNTNIIQDYQTRTDRLDFSEAYERKFKKYESLGRLFPVDIKSEVDLFPDQNRYTLKANYLLENKNDTAVNQVFITAKESVENIQLENATLIEHDTFFETYLFQLNNPLLPKERLKYAFEIVHQQKGYETPRTLVNNGSYILHTDLGPSLIYRNSKEIHDNHERKKRGLPKREEETINEDHLHLEEAKIGKLPFETIVSTQADQTAIAPGNLIKQWTENGRDFYHYKTGIPVTPLLGYFSARYQTKKVNHHGVSIEQYYHPGHEYNIEVIEKSAKYALDYCIENFGPYPFDHLRIAEIPGHWNFGGQAMPGTISMVEDRMYLI